MIGKIKKIGNDLLFHAINHANVHDVIALLEENEVDVNCPNINGQTPLHVSIFKRLFFLTKIESCFYANYNSLSKQL
jgi:ankyrin repeat protein